MSCHEIQMYLTAYVDDALEIDKRNRVEQHLRQCYDCQALVKELQQTTALVFEQLNRTVAPINFEDSVMQQIAGVYQERQVRRFSIFYLACALIGIGGFAAVLLSPVGTFIRVLFHLFLAVLNGLSFVPASLGHWWMVCILLSTIVLVGSSIFGVSRVLRSLQSEVVL
ncbi:anti-sigma factor family protein [Alicyclobacillus suci]|uniref:anti-sigma factor family protein n=1 Tax=Alicyclobacillus suci TaxID=2816080 RepID=UPI001A8C060C|nr:zf-HC2 domain-containing protein [Alicyclobacillus suci]